MIYFKAFIFIILTSAILAFLGTRSDIGMTTLRYFLFIAPPYALFGLGYMAYARKKNINDGNSYSLAGMLSGSMAGLFIALIINVTNGYADSTLALISTVIGLFFGGQLAYVLWAIIENKDRKPKIYAVIFLLGIALFMDSLNWVGNLED